MVVLIRATAQIKSLKTLVLWICLLHPRHSLALYVRLRKHAKPLVLKCNGVPHGVLPCVVQRKDEETHGKGRRRHNISTAGGGTDDGTGGHPPNERIPSIPLSAEGFGDAFRRGKSTRSGTEQESRSSDDTKDGSEF
jgi:hypothetical protein